MPKSRPRASTPASKFVKQDLAERLRGEILAGHLVPGQRIIESFWAGRFGVAQTSVREAINLLIAAGFVTKATGRSARVTKYDQADIAEIYDLRGAIEGLAGRLAAQRGADMTALHKTVGEMQSAIRAGDMQKLLDADMRFHLELCECSGNRYLSAQARALLLPLFAFVAIRAGHTGQKAGAWEADLARHRRIAELIEEGDPAAAEFAIRGALRRFADRATQIWEEPQPALAVAPASRR